LICPFAGGLSGRAIVSVAATGGDIASRIAQSAKVIAITASRGTQIDLSRMTHSSLKNFSTLKSNLAEGSLK
jgi:hypothetical protein